MGFLAGHLSRVPSPSDLLVAAARVQRRLGHLGARAAAWRSNGLGPGTALLLSGATAQHGAVELGFDGRLTNRAELAARLLAEGHRPVGDGDADLVAAGWAAWGTALLPRLQGAFAMAVLDRARGELVLARDRSGQRPLLVAARGDTVLFASELPALLAWPGVARAPDLDALAVIMAFGHAPAERTPMAGVARLRPGHLLRIRAGGTVEERRWWDPPVLSGTPAGPRPSAAALTEHILGEVRAGCAGWEGASLMRAESLPLLLACLDPTSRAPAAGTEGVAPDADLFRRMLWHAGEPIAPEDAVPALSAGARGMRVFTPTAAPELFLAHARYRHFAQGLAKRRGMPPGRIRTTGFHDGVAATRDLWHEAAGMMSEAERLELTGPALLHTLVFAAPDAYGLSLEEAGPGDAMARASLLDLRMRLPARDLPALHVASALTGATFVAPFLDGALLELLAGLPDAARRWLLPSPAVAPSAGDPAWHPLGPALREFTEDNLLGAPARARGLFSRARVEALLHRHAASPARDPRPVWMLLGMEVWCQTFLGTELDMDRMEPAEPDMPAEVQAAA